ncbi:MAG: TonB-dependent receptor [Proteiniphilum sp.]|uniref:TonB-dependent receptor n=1 Tax=Proteiniphilum sp. TaxID=1926877 RepID=UPI002B202938|nr:TonB-dependent receptor [Proteiniphilum sp.]MEA5127862.1 TonB-dependent receptor [Proteiniphilum sp.]
MRFILLLFLFLPVHIYCQNEISGRIVQQKGNEPLDFANVVIHTEDSVFVAGTTSDKSGKFIFRNVPSANYTITITYLGYISENITLKGLSKSVDLGDIIVYEDVTLLDAVTVTASPVTHKIDRLVVFVTDRQKAHSSDGINLLATMQLPRLTVNLLMGSISLPGDEKIQLSINGAKVDENDIKAIKPDEVVRIEYIDNPGVRYGDASVVINYILKRPTTGGSIGLNTMNAVTSLFGNEQVAFKLNYKKSEFGLIYSGRFREMDEGWADKVTHFRFSDKDEMIRYDNGVPGDWKENFHLFTVNYSHLDEKNYFNAAVKYSLTDMDKMTHTNQSTSLTPSRITSVHQGAKTVQHLPSVDLYFLHSLKEDRILIFNVVGTYINSDIDQVYEEVKDNEVITGIISDVDGKKYSVIGEGIYEQTFDNNHRFSAGLKHMQAFADNHYTGTINSLAKMDQSESYAYMEYSGKTDKFSYMGGAGISRSWTKQEGEQSHTDYVFRPKITLQYNFKPEMFIRIRGERDNTAPSLANVSAVEQYIDTLRITRGNPGLKANANYQIGFTFSWDKNIFGINYDASYRYSPDAIMEEILRENDLFISTFYNQKNWQKLNNELTFTVNPIQDMLTVSLTGGINRYLSNGNNYSHKHTNYYYRASLMFMVKKFMAQFQANNAYNNLWGETLYGGENTQQITVMYNQGKFVVGAGIISPFSGNYKRRTENMNTYSPYESYGYINNLSRMVMINFSCHFDFGRKAKTENKRMNNTDSDTGIIQVN